MKETKTMFGRTITIYEYDDFEIGDKVALVSDRQKSKAPRYLEDYELEVIGKGKKNIKVKAKEFPDSWTVKPSELRKIIVNKSPVISNQIYTVQRYCSEFLNFCPVTEASEDELRCILDTEGYDDLWDYPLDEINEIVENMLSVVLVDTTYINDNLEIVPEYRWFEVPKEFRK